MIGKSIFQILTLTAAFSLR